MKKKSKSKKGLKNVRAANKARIGHPCISLPERTYTFDRVNKVWVSQGLKKNVEGQTRRLDWI